MDQARRVSGAVRRVALLPWGDLIEDFLAELGMTFAAFRDEMTGGWLFGYVEALRRVGIETVIVCVSAEVDAVERATHRPTGAALRGLPAARPPRVVARRARGSGFSRGRTRIAPCAGACRSRWPRARRRRSRRCGSREPRGCSR